MLSWFLERNDDLYKLTEAAQYHAHCLLSVSDTPNSLSRVSPISGSVIDQVTCDISAAALTKDFPEYRTVTLGAGGDVAGLFKM